MYLRALCLSLAVVSSASWAEAFQSGDLEVVVNALPASELTDEASASYNVARDKSRGVLTVVVTRQRPGRVEAVPAQIYAGAVNQANHLINIPVRELRSQDGVQYLGEFRLNGSQAMKFLVNVNVLGRLVKAEFSRIFPSP